MKKQSFLRSSTHHGRRKHPRYRHRRRRNLWSFHRPWPPQVCVCVCEKVAALELRVSNLTKMVVCVCINTGLGSEAWCWNLQRNLERQDSHLRLGSMLGKPWKLSAFLSKFAISMIAFKGIIRLTLILLLLLFRSTLQQGNLCFDLLMMQMGGGTHFCRKTF